MLSVFLLNDITEGLLSLNLVAILAMFGNLYIKHVLKVNQ